jgi:hypothetical protein
MSYGIKAIQELKHQDDQRDVEIERLKAENTSMKQDFQRQINELKSSIHK